MYKIRFQNTPLDHKAQHTNRGGVGGGFSLNRTYMRLEVCINHFGYPHVISSLRDHQPTPRTGLPWLFFKSCVRCLTVYLICV